ncbi:HU family DNA-binding protein [Candidatus Nitrotoga sp. HW29]|uniref:HU family DNA-binding protein n=1 Tax=Candidatus Nitrotoga sp. HW29 TaxID=2886963 RepID=UPI002A4E2502|nr:HU family DNA-binding protein [Candidatus Nitrotoga sp. HW29]
MDALTTKLSNGGHIELHSFGSFTLSYRPPRIGCNPTKGERVEVFAKYVPHFKATNELLASVFAK